MKSAWAFDGNQLQFSDAGNIHRLTKQELDAIVQFSSNGKAGTIEAYANPANSMQPFWQQGNLSDQSLILVRTNPSTGMAPGWAIQNYAMDESLLDSTKAVQHEDMDVLDEELTKLMHEWRLSDSAFKIFRQNKILCVEDLYEHVALEDIPPLKLGLVDERKAMKLLLWIKSEKDAGNAKEPAPKDMNPKETNKNPMTAEASMSKHQPTDDFLWKTIQEVNLREVTVKADPEQPQQAAASGQSNTVTPEKPKESAPKPQDKTTVSTSFLCSFGCGFHGTYDTVTKHEGSCALGIAQDPIAVPESLLQTAANTPPASGQNLYDHYFCSFGCGFGGTYQLVFDHELAAHKNFFCQGHCGFSGSYETVLEHEKSCDLARVCP